MNNFKRLLFMVLCCGFGVAGRAQTNLASTNAPVTNGTYLVTARDANSRQWARISARTNGAGQVTFVTNRAYLELASGLNRFSTESNAWVDADTTIALAGNSASATGTAHSVTFAQDAATAGGAVNLTTPDGKNFVSRVYGLAYWDATTGSNVLLGSIQSAQGNVVGASEVVYSNAFSGSVTADLEYFNKLSGLEQNVVLRTALPEPDMFGLSDATARLQIWTEFLSAPEPQEVQGTTDDVSEDLMLDFGAMKMGQGKAFITPQEQGRMKESHVSKHWLHLDGRTFLIEEVPYRAISNVLQNLPAHASVTSPSAGGTRTIASMLPLRSRMLTTNAPVGPMRLADATSSSPGMVIDYVLVGSYETNYIFQADTTYYVSGPVSLYGTNGFEGGTVLKFNQSFGEIGNFGASPLAINGSSYRPINFTSSDDNSIGETISGSTGNPHQGLLHDYLLDGYTGGATNVTMSRVRFSYAPCAYEDDTAGSSHLFRDCQFVQCGNDDTLLLPSGTDLYLENVLFSHINIGLGTGMTLHAVNITADTITNFLDPIFWSGGGGGITNSILTGCDASILTNFNLYYTVTNASGSGIYQTAGAGNYYLTNGSAGRNAATANIDAATLADLQGMTTYPPILISTNFSGNTTLIPQATRDVGLLDSGYHYPPLDYICTNLTVNSGVTLVLTNGVAVGTLDSTGLTVNGNLVSVGTPGNLNYLGSCEAVQEERGTNLATLFGGGAPWQSMYFRFAQLSMLGGAGNYFYVEDYSPLSQVTAGPLTFQDSQLAGGTMYALVGYFYDGFGDESSLSISLINDILDRCDLYLADAPYGDEAYFNLYCRNVLFHAGSFYGTYALDNDGATWTFFDNLFDNTTLSVTDNNDPMPTGLYNMNSAENGYINTGPITNYFTYYYPGIAGDGVNDLYPAVADYQTGTLGQFYYPTSGGNLSQLIHMGYWTAASFGLYHYTVTTNNAIEGANTVSIGFHYMGMDQYGNPLSTLVPGVPDYLVDANGDGVYDSGDLLNWNNPFAIYDQGMSYDGYYPANVRLGYWKFDNGTLTNQHGIAPSSVSSDVSIVSDWSGNALLLTNSSGSDLEYLLVTNGWTNLDYANGTVRFWYQPSAAYVNNTNFSPALYGSLIKIGVSPTSDQWAFGLQSPSNNTSGICYLTFNVTSNGYSESPLLNIPVTFQPSNWYQIVVTYSPTNVALYTNGVLLATGGSPPQDSSGNPLFTFGDGLSMIPSWNNLTNVWVNPTFGFGNDGVGHGGDTAMGEFDELETFNYPLTPQAIAAGFPNFGGNSTNMLDTNYVGRSDMLQYYVDGVFPPTNITNVTQCRLGYWRFDSPLLFAEQGQMPLSQSGVTLSNSWSGTAVNIGSASSSQLTYPDVGTNGWANINCQRGTVRLWFKPDWNAGSGPSWAPLIYMGNNSTPANGEWSLQVTNSGNTIDFVTASNGATTVLSASSGFLNSSHWSQIVLTYGPGGSYLYTNGVMAASNLTMLAKWPNLADRERGMAIGNNTGHTAALHGQIDELETFNYPLTDDEVATNFAMVAAVDRDLDGVPDVLEDIHLTNSTPYLGAPVVITGTVKAEEFDMGGTNVAYHAARSYPTNVYRSTKMFITNCDDLGQGYCLAMGASDWANYSINVLATGAYVVEARVAGMGTGGTFQVSITNSPTNGPTSTPMTITTTNWTNISCQMTLTNLGTNVLTLTGVAAGTDSPYVGRFSYISVYPFVPTPTVGSGSYTVSSSSLSNNMADFLSASNNAYWIQNAVNSMYSTGGGTVTIPPGTYYVAQVSPNESDPVYENAAVGILSSNIAICGAGLSNTTLVAFDRVTTIFSVGIDQFTNSASQPVTNFTLSGLTIEGQPHEVSYPNSSMGFTNVCELGQFNPGPYIGGVVNQETSALTYFDGPTDVLITNCEFLHTYWGIKGGFNNCLIQGCTFIQWDSNCLFTGAINTSPTNANTVGIANQNVSIFASGTNIVLLNNIYNGNAALINTNATLTATSYVNTNLSDRAAPDGFVWLQGGGNVFIARNAISNNFIEAIQLNQGPNAVVENTFYTLLNNAGGECAMNFFGGGFPGLVGYNLPSYSDAFVNNQVYGEGSGALSDVQSLQTNASGIHVSGNYFYQPYPPFNEMGSGYGAAVMIGCCPTASVCGNTMAAGWYGLSFTLQSTNALVLNNDFGSAGYVGIGYPIPGAELAQAQVYGNKIGQGLSFHAQMNYPDNFGWFFKGNTFLNGTNVVPPFFDPVGNSAHVSN